MFHLIFLIDNILVVFDCKVFQQTVCICIKRCQMCSSFWLAIGSSKKLNLSTRILHNFLFLRNILKYLSAKKPFSFLNAYVIPGYAPFMSSSYEVKGSDFPLSGGSRSDVVVTLLACGTMFPWFKPGPPYYYFRDYVSTAPKSRYD